MESAFSYVPGIGAGAPTPWLGVVERLMIYAYLLWVAVLAVALVRRDRFGAAEHRVAALDTSDVGA